MGERWAQGCGGGVVFLSASVLVTVPSGAWVTVFSLVLTVPSLLTEVLVSLETWRSQPMTSTDTAKVVMPTQVMRRFFFM